MNHFVPALLAAALVSIASSPALAASKEEIDAEVKQAPIIGFIFSNKGLMYNLTFEGSKITKLDK